MEGHILQILACALFCSCVQSIRVTFGTNNGPIEPPTPEPVVVPQPPFREPAPIWEDRSGDAPDPNASWRPPLFVPQPMYTKVLINQEQPKQQLSETQKFVNAYKPKTPTTHTGITKPLFVPNLIKTVPELSSQNIPGVGLRYFVPADWKVVEKKKEAQQEDAKLNDLETNDIGGGVDDSDELQWKYEKEARRRTRGSQEGSYGARITRPVYNYQYQWPAYFPSRHQ